MAETNRLKIQLQISYEGNESQTTTAISDTDHNARDARHLKLRQTIRTRLDADGFVVPVVHSLHY
jgi:hypothetical protein